MRFYHCFIELYGKEGETMKRFLINVIFGVVLMAIGATMLLMEVEDFEVVDGRQIFKDEYKTYSVSVKDQELNIRFLQQYGDRYEWKTDENLKDEVKIELLEDADYIFYKDKNQLDIRNIYTDKSYERNSIQYLSYIIDGLKQKKIYTLRGSSTLVITSSLESRSKIKFNTMNYKE